MNSTFHQVLVKSRKKTYEKGKMRLAVAYVTVWALLTCTTIYCRAATSTSCV